MDFCFVIITFFVMCFVLFARLKMFDVCLSFLIAFHVLGVFFFVNDRLRFVCVFYVF